MRHLGRDVNADAEHAHGVFLIAFAQEFLSLFAGLFSVFVTILLNSFLHLELTTIEHDDRRDLILQQQVDSIETVLEKFVETLASGQVLRTRVRGLVQPAVRVNRKALALVLADVPVLLNVREGGKQSLNSHLLSVALFSKFILRSIKFTHKAAFIMLILLQLHLNIQIW